MSTSLSFGDTATPGSVKGPGIPSGAAPAAPLRAELLGLEGMEDLGKRLAASYTISKKRRRGVRAFFSRIDENAGLIRHAYRILAEDVHRGEPLAPAAEWLLDNFHLLEAELGGIQRDLPRSYYLELPKLAGHDLGDAARIHAIGIELVRHSDASFDEPRLARFISAFQTVVPLTIGELWALPSILRIALIENVRRITEEILRQRNGNLEADACIAELDHRPGVIPKLPAALTDACIVRLIQRIREHGPGVAELRAKIEARLATSARTAEDVIRAEHQAEATAQVSMGNSITSLRGCATLDWSRFFEEVSLVEQVLRRDPRGTYARMDFESRDRYRRAVEELADRTGDAQLEVALKSVENARSALERDRLDDRAAHIGWHLIAKGRRAFEDDVAYVPSPLQRMRRFIFAHATAAYLGAIAVFTFLGLCVAGEIASSDGNASAGGAAAWPSLLAALLLAAIPASELAIGIVQALSAKLAGPRRLPRIDLEAGVPDYARTMVVVPTILATSDGLVDQLTQLEIRALGNLDPNIYFALLTDFPDSEEPERPGEAELLAAAQRGIESLNARIRGAGGFHLFHRGRTFNPKEGIWMGWERKRGKLEELNRLLRGATDTRYVLHVGDPTALPSIRFVITLDTDTRLPRGVAKMLIGIILHPLNLPRFDPELGRVTEGYAILQPRVSVTMSSAAGSLFARVYAGHTGVDPYTTAVSDTYQDLFGEGIFTGKGLYDVDAFMAALDSRAPENAILSHDLFEGLYARAALVSDIEVVDDYPSSVLAHARRLHRWVRGDWQILLWLLPRVPTRRGLMPNRLPLISRWKIFDNLRRSLVQPSLVALLVAGWTVLPGQALGWTGAVLAVLALPIYPHLFRPLRGPPRSQNWRVFLNSFREDLETAAAQTLLSLVFLAYHAFEIVHAIGLTLLRLFFLKRRLLEWETSASAARRGRAAATGGEWSSLREMVASPAAGLGLVFLIAGVNPKALFIALPILGLWIFEPFLAFWLSRPAPTHKTELSRDQRRTLRGFARRTWSYFERFMSAEDHFLPPDNHQLEHGPRTAHRTSPTNIGFGLLSTLAAHDFGWITTASLIQRLERALGTLEGLERHRGHILNWFDTKTLSPLHPRYVSTVDSGNLACALISLAEGLRGLAGAPVDPRRRIEGLEDTCAILRESLEALDRAAPVAAEKCRYCCEILRAIDRALVFGGEHDGPERGEAALLRAAEQVPDLERAIGILSEHTGPERDVVLRWGAALGAELVLGPEPSAAAAVRDRDAALEDLAERARAIADGMDFRFLYDRRRRIFAIGYRLADADGPGRLDGSYYDLLASEARLASIFAIAKGDVPDHHWFSLGRPITSIRGDPVLLSWSATMFEYLTPLLLLETYPNTLLDRSCRVAVRRQIDYGGGRGVPWGISESAFNVVDREGNYQYKAFGVPGLGLKRGLADDLVVAPYATALASMLEPIKAEQNLVRLCELGLLGEHGFFEAIDYAPRETDEREGGGRRSSKSEGLIVRAFFAHHQAMSLLAFAHVLLGKPMVLRFHSDRRVSSIELLLQERVPRLTPTTEPRPPEETRRPRHARGGSAIQRFRTPSTPYPKSHFLSNGIYTVVVTNSGGGYSACRGLSVTRRREDRTRDLGSQLLYLRDVRSGELSSPTYQPFGGEPGEYLASFHLDKVVIRRRFAELETLLEIAVSPEDDAEMRRLSITNQGPREREIEVTSYVELALAPPREDFAHPAFGNLFLETEHLPESAALLCARRPRSAADPPVVAFHVVSVEGRSHGSVEWETDRARFLGRGRGTDDPIALDGRALSGRTGAVLDPIFSLRQRVRLPPGGFARISFATGVATTRPSAVQLAQKYHDQSCPARTFALAFTQAQSGLRHLGIEEGTARLFDRLASRVFGTDASLRAPPDVLAKNTLGQAGLWGHGISGDLPILLLRVVESDDLPLVQHVLKAQEYWRLKGLSGDVVIVNEHPVSYLDEMHASLTALIESGSWSAWKGKPGGVFLLRGDAMTEAERVLLQSVARAVLVGDRGELSHQLDRLSPEPRWPKAFVPRAAAISDAGGSIPLEVPPLIFAHGLGGFTPDGREYVVTLDQEADTPLPWVNVLANPSFGSVVGTSGSAYTWSENSRENRLTPFANDAVTDPSGEAIFLRDGETGEVWGATPGSGPRPNRQGGWLVRHGAGKTRYTHGGHGLLEELTLFVPPDAPVKVTMLRLTNRTARQRALSAFAYVEWTLGPPNMGDEQHVVTELESSIRAVLARNPYNTEHSGRIAFLQSSLPPRSATGDRLEFIGRNGGSVAPAGLFRSSLAGRFGAGLDPCAALEVSITLAPGETRELVILLGQGKDAEEVRALIDRFSPPSSAKEALEKTEAFWERILGTIQVKTPDDSFDTMINRWLLYQDLCCRVWARSAFYQSGGAFGFRDQLQDVVALIHARPDLVREHLLRAAARQFVEGDVQHWWHPPSGRGTRTHCSDDLLFLPYAVTEYVEVTGDAAALDVEIPFIEAPPLQPEEHEVYGLPAVSAQKASLYEHCARAVEKGITAGAHGLPLIGGGDWNDGMNRVGQKGRGESVWLGWFLHSVLRAMAPIADARGDPNRAARWKGEASRLEMMLALAWDGEWYRRAYFDDGTPLGSAQNDECKIDSLTQSWAVLSGAAQRDRAERAMDSVRAQLVRRDARMILLLTPPFDRTELDPGYIKSYVPGIRENGGQYTHAAIWTVMAVAKLGGGDEAVELFHLLNPINHTRTAGEVARYKVEPYVIAADVYAHSAHVGRGGWTWYTGSAGWMYRAGLESILGFRRHGRVFSIAPCIPAAWNGFSIDWRSGDTRYVIEVKNPAEVTAQGLATLDGEAVDPAAIPILDDGGRHEVKIVLSRRQPAAPARL